MKVLFTQLMKMSPTSIGLLLLLYPLLIVIFFGALKLALYFTKYELLFSSNAVSMLLYVVVFFTWTWGVIFYIEDPKPTSTTLFKITYWITLSGWLLNLASEFHLFGNSGFWLDGPGWTIFFLVLDLFNVLFFAGFVYLCYFVAQKINTFQPAEKGANIIAFVCVFLFPIGIPIFQEQVKRQFAAQPKKAESHFITRY